MSQDRNAISLFEIIKKLSAEVFHKDGYFTQYENLKKVFVNKFTTLEKADDSDLSFFSGKAKHKDALFQTKARACIIDSASLERLESYPSDMWLIVVKDINFAFAEVMQLFYLSVPVLKEDISKDAFIDESAIIGKNCEIMHGSFIGKNVKIGNNVKIYPNVFIGDGVQIDEGCIIFHSITILHAIIGSNTIIHSGVRIGQDGFRYVTNEVGQHIKVPHIGRVIIGKDVEIGANSTIDRGSISDTVIGDMCKLDNLVQIGHNVVLGKGCIIVSQVGIAGSVVIGDYVAIGGQAGIADNISIASYSKIAAQSGVMKNTLEKEIVIGSPAQPIKDFFKQVVAMKKITKGEKL